MSFNRKFKKHTKIKVKQQIIFTPVNIDAYDLSLMKFRYLEGLYFA